MGVFDQAARFAAQSEPFAVVNRLVRDLGNSFTFTGWVEPRSSSLPGEDERVADLIAVLAEATEPPLTWFLIVEFQAQTDEKKLRVLLEESDNLHTRGRPKEYPPGLPVLASLVYLVGRCPCAIIRMMTQNGKGLLFEAIEWNLCDDDANFALDGVASGLLTWGTLFWVPLMANASEEPVIRRWKDLVDTLPSLETRESLIGIAMVFSELAKCYLEWERVLKGWETMTESKVVNTWIERTEERTQLRERREFLVRLLESRFPNAVAADVLSAIRDNNSAQILADWLNEAFVAPSIDDFVRFLRK